MRQGFVVVEGFYLAAVTGDIACILKMGFFFFGGEWNYLRRTRKAG